MRLGDRVKLGAANGVVVFIIDTGEFSEGYPSTSWSYLKKGAMIEFDQYGLIHYTVPEEVLELVSRAPLGAAR